MSDVAIPAAPIDEHSLQTRSDSGFDIIVQAIANQEDFGRGHTQALDGGIENLPIRLAMTRLARERDSVEKAENVEALHNGIYPVVKI